MNSLILDVNHMLKNKNFEYAFCGGYAIDLFLGQITRKHGDIDVLAYWKDRDAIIEYMWTLGFEVYEMIGGGQAHRITNVNNQMKLKRNIVAVNNCGFVRFEPFESADVGNIDFLSVEQTEPNFIEFLFNDKTETDFLYARDRHVKRSLDKTILFNNEIPYLAPEICLLYKSTDTDRAGYQHDYDFAIKAMNCDQKDWLNNSLKHMFPAGHKWIERNEDYLC